MSLPSKQPVSYTMSPQWDISQDDTSLIITGGADARYSIDLETNTPSFFSKLTPTTTFHRSDLPLRDQRVLEELLTAEIVVPILPPKPSAIIGVIGDDNQLELPTDNTSSADLLVVVRTTSSYATLLKNITYEAITTPHLFIDLAFHHTLSIGPLVFPGETACVACLQGRVTTRWGDDIPPVAPRTATVYTPTIIELLKTELDRIHQGDTSLVGTTYSWNFQDRIIKKDRLLKVPLCPICAQSSIDGNGALALPWTEHEGVTDPV